MAKVSAHGEERCRVENDSVRYRAMSDGVILRQMKIMGKWEAPTIARRCASEAEAIRRVSAQTAYSYKEVPVR